MIKEITPLNNLLLLLMPIMYIGSKTQLSLICTTFYGICFVLVLLSRTSRLQASQGHGYFPPFCNTHSNLHIIYGNEKRKGETNPTGCSCLSEAALRAPGRSDLERQVSFLSSLGSVVAFFHLLEFVGVRKEIN